MTLEAPVPAPRRRWLTPGLLTSAALHLLVAAAIGAWLLRPAIPRPTEPPSTIEVTLAAPPAAPQAALGSANPGSARTRLLDLKPSLPDPSEAPQLPLPETKAAPQRQQPASANRPRLEATPRLEAAEADHLVPPLADEGKARPHPPAADKTPADAYYLAALSAWLEQHKEYPPAARAAGIRGSVLVSFVLDRAGNVSNFHIVSSSGSALLDAAARRTLVESGPMPPMPDTVPGGQLALNLTVIFGLD